VGFHYQQACGSGQCPLQHPGPPPGRHQLRQPCQWKCSSSVSHLVAGEHALTLCLPHEKVKLDESVANLVCASVKMKKHHTLQCVHAIQRLQDTATACLFRAGLCQCPDGQHPHVQPLRTTGREQCCERAADRDCEQFVSALTGVHGLGVVHLCVGKGQRYMQQIAALCCCAFTGLLVANLEYA